MTFLPIAVAALSAGLFGCAGRTVVNPAPLASVRVPPEEQTYRLRPGDVLDIKFLYSPEFDETVTIRPDGRITIPLAQEVEAAGLTPAELTRRLTQESSRQLRAPHVTVMVRTFSANQVYVAGEVRSPQLIRLEGGLTALQAITQAGGFVATSRFRDVILIRRMPDGTPKATVLNMNRVLSGTDLAQDVELRPRDILYVPEKSIARVGRFVQQYIKDVLPFRVGLSFSYKLDEERHDPSDDDLVDPNAVKQ